VRHSAALQCVRVCQQSQHHTAVSQSRVPDSLPVVSNIAYVIQPVECCV
jgi:hypothetical protein